MSWFSRFRQRPARQNASVTRARQQRDYVLGAGEAEISRLDLQHCIFRWELGDDFLAPVTNPRAILDVACGTGRWAREVARRFPQANIIGFDINYEQIERSLAEGAARGSDLMPKNCTFVAGDALQRFAFAEGAFDLVMARATSAFMPASRYPELIAEMTRVARPGGWIELRDFGLVRSGSRALTELTELFKNLMAARGQYPGAGPYLAELIARAGLRAIQVKTVTVRSGSQPSRGGRMMLADYLALMERLSPIMERAGLASQVHWQQLLEVARQETTSQSAEGELTAAYGQREA
jgi:ubiquinone/menaquinone biosynthesis C-methylase UbiE